MKKTDSILPCPKGWSLSLGSLSILAPINTKILFIKSEKEFILSAIKIFSEKIYPKINFKNANNMLKIIENFTNM